MSVVWEPLLVLLVAAFSLVVLYSIFRPVRGFYHRWRRNRETNARVLQEDVVKHVYKCEARGRAATLQSIAGALELAADDAAHLVDQTLRRGLTQADGTEFHLTEEGRRYALHIIRAHRLWERYLADETGIDESEWHSRAERSEHNLTADELDSLAERLGHPTHDPHGDPIPTSDGELISHKGRPLSVSSAGDVFRIVHVEDEPPAVYSQLVAEGLYPGMAGRVLEASARRIRIWAEGEEHTLSPLVAANLSVVLMEKDKADEPSELDRLTALRPGEKGTVARISQACRGTQRRRFLDLGILPGTTIEAAFASPGGDPTAYRVRGTLIALRRDQAETIFIDRLPRSA